eukprot:m.21630 g.21630  ORF g.21630 m.21630 type:complete len:54 (-) comp8309_c0_seq3:1780-1941(-)
MMNELFNDENSEDAARNATPTEAKDRSSVNQFLFSTEMQMETVSWTARTLTAT